MRIALLTLGTRGDVQPFAVLGRALKERGHQVTLSTGANFERLATDYGLDFAPVKADFQALINSDEGKAMMKNPFLARKHFKTTVQPMMVDALKSFYATSKDADCVLYHVKSLGDFFADQFPHKMMRTNVVPALQPTSAFPNPVFSSLSFPRFLNRLTYRLADLGLAMMNKAIRDFRISSSLTPPLPKKIDVPSIYGISPSYLPKPGDFPDDTYFTGFWHSQSPSQLSDDVKEFVASADTVLVTFGSMPFEAKFDLPKSLIRISEALKVNILVVKGWGFEDHAVLDGQKSIKVIDTAPFDKLFPKVKAVVHHGGIGTIAECLRAGVPFFSCPVIFPMGDQHFWGILGYQNGCSPKPIALKNLNEDTLLRNISSLLTNEDCKKNSVRLQKLLQAENGLDTAVRIIESQFAKIAAGVSGK